MMSVELCCTESLNTKIIKLLLNLDYFFLTTPVANRSRIRTKNAQRVPIQGDGIFRRKDY
jgi:hypothetical protein